MLIAQEQLMSRCEGYQLAVETLSKQVSGLASLVQQADLRSLAREKILLNQLTELQVTLKQLF